MGKVLSGELSCTETVLVNMHSSGINVMSSEFYISLCVMEPFNLVSREIDKGCLSLCLSV